MTDFASQPNRQQPKKQDDTNPKDRAPGPRTAVEVVTPAMGPKASGFVGTGTQGVAARKPFKVGGG